MSDTPADESLASTSPLLEDEQQPQDIHSDDSNLLEGSPKFAADAASDEPTSPIEDADEAAAEDKPDSNGNGNASVDEPSEDEKQAPAAPTTTTTAPATPAKKTVGTAVKPGAPGAVAVKKLAPGAASATKAPVRAPVGGAARVSGKEAQAV